MIVDIDSFHIFSFDKIQLAPELVISNTVSFNFDKRLKTVAKSSLRIQKLKPVSFTCSQSNWKASVLCLKLEISGQLSSFDETVLGCGVLDR
jgi:hypothetical protein